MENVLSDNNIYEKIEADQSQKNWQAIFVCYFQDGREMKSLIEVPIGS